MEKPPPASMRHKRRRIQLTLLRQNRNPNSTVGSASCVTRSELASCGMPKVGELKTKPRYSARMNKCLELMFGKQRASSIWN
jgi:hypothetical protein